MRDAAAASSFTLVLRTECYLALSTLRLMLGKMLSSVRALLLTLIIGVIVCAAFRNNKGFVRGPMIANSRSQSQSTALNMATYKVTLRQEGKELAVLDVPDDKVLLDVALDAGIDLPHDCKLGMDHTSSILFLQTIICNLM